MSLRDRLTKRTNGPVPTLPPPVPTPVPAAADARAAPPAMRGTGAAVTSTMVGGVARVRVSTFDSTVPGALSAAFDKLYDAARKLPDSPERNKLYDQMAHQMEVDAAWRLGVHRIRNQIIRPEVKGYKKHPVMILEAKYLDVARTSVQ